MSPRVWPGRSHPLGAIWDGDGVNFAVFSGVANRVELWLFEHPAAVEPSERIAMPPPTDQVWHAYLPDARPGALYGYRVDDAGPLLDPYARELRGSFRWTGEGPTSAESIEAGVPAEAVPGVPKCVVVDPAFSWGDDRPPATPWHRSLIYECHVRGMSMRHPGVPEELRGTYLGLASDPIVDHLVSLGVTAVELLPVQHFVEDRRLVDRGLTNYWGYNTIAFLAPYAGYAAFGQPVAEFKSMVRTLHRAGIEVILDVVYNHTGEGDHLAFSLRGIDEQAYYRSTDVTGTGNTLRTDHPRALALVMDSLRHWVTEMHVDGFRFDLAPALARVGEDGRPNAFFDVVGQDPVLAGVKLIAEPWDLGPDGYQLGRFPPRWAEWNDAYRDVVRRFWRGDPGQVPGLASRLAGSSDIFGPSGRRTSASVNFVTCHDGFTLADLVSFEHRHNEANGEGPDDGAAENFSRNWGVEGATGSARVRQVRARMQRNLLATLLCSQGVRMLLGGDEIGRTQQGNNNAFCQDNEVSWVDWDLDEPRRELLGFVQSLTRVVREHPVLRRRSFFTGGGDLTWLRPDGWAMTDADWENPENRTLGMLMLGQAADEMDHRGRKVPGDTLLLLLHAGPEALGFTLPSLAGPGSWSEVFSTGRPGPTGRPVRHEQVTLGARSCLLLRFA